MLIKIKVMTGARLEKITRSDPNRSDLSYSVSVKEKAERNMANERVIEIIKKLHPGKSVRIIHGHHRAGKTVEVK